MLPLITAEFLEMSDAPEAVSVGMFLSGMTSSTIQDGARISPDINKAKILLTLILSE